jgi:hypothetical protein
MILAWTAGPDGIAHAAPPGLARSLCGVRSRPARWSWPARSRCPSCAAVELWGGRKSSRAAGRLSAPSSPRVKP